MKKIYLLTLILLSHHLLIGQASLPTTWDFANTPNPPKGWSYDLGTGTKTVYTVGSFVKTNPALRLDWVNEFIQVHFADEPGNFLYHIAGTGSSPWQGTVLIQESSNGTTFNTIRTYTDGDVTSSSRLDSVSLNLSSRYVRILFSNKVSGYNLAIDDATIRKAPPKPEAEIDITYNNENIILGSTIQTGNENTISLAIQNAGTQDKLYLGNVSITGPDASLFTPSFTVDSIDPLSTKNLNITFSPMGVTGDKKATVTIQSNDANEGNFVIDLYAIFGSLATEPTNMGYSLKASSNLTWKKELTLTAPSLQPQGWLLIQSVGALNSKPQDQVSYQLGEGISNGKIIYKGSDTSFISQGVVANRAYQYNLFPFNGYDSFINYSTLPIQLNLNAVSNDPLNYYTGISTDDPGFITKLQNKINPHFQIFYSNYPSTIIKNFYERDTIAGKKVITAQYSGYHYQYTPPFAFDTISREHVYPYSWMPETDKDKPNYSDLYNLHPVHQDRSNGIRSNYPLGEVNEVLFTFVDSKFGRDTAGNLVYEPRDAMKGACARSIFYMLSCYNGADGRTWWLNPAQSEAVLKDWHNQFPPSDFEIARSNYITSVQNNRNPFIDSPQMACYINFYDMSYNPNGAINCGNPSSVKGIQTNASLSIYPNPATHRFNLKLNSNLKGSLIIYDVYGKEIKRISNVGDEQVIDVSELANGTYLLILEGDDLLAVSKLIKH